MRLSAVIVGCVLAACSSPEMRRARSLMDSPIVPASDAIFNAVIYTNGQLASAPSTPAEWDRLAQHGRSLVAAGTSLAALAPPDDPAGWIQQSEALRAASSAALEAIEARDLDRLLDAGSRVYDTCTACHDAYVKEP